MNKFSRILLIIGSLSVISIYFLPLWEIKLWAPQYPEGLTVEIWHDDVKGDVEIINGLNHYIGMKHIKKEMFPEFVVLKYIIALFIAWGLFVGIKGTRKWLKIYCFSILLGGLVALGDFYRWGYDYGHNLDPSAPIQVPGMAYQPPVLGYKVLLNFTALSIPSTGGWIVVGLGIAAWILLLWDWFKSRKASIKVVMLGSVLLSLGLMTSCMQVRPDIRFGIDDCDFCRMKIMDNRFGVAITTDKGRSYKFDDVHCYRGFLAENPLTLKHTFVVLFDKPGMMANASDAFFMRSPELKSPMGSNVAAWSSQEACKKNESTYHAFCTTFTAVLAELK